MFPHCKGRHAHLLTFFIFFSSGFILFMCRSRPGPTVVPTVPTAQGPRIMGAPNFYVCLCICIASERRIWAVSGRWATGPSPREKGKEQAPLARLSRGLVCDSESNTEYETTNLSIDQGIDLLAGRSAHASRFPRPADAVTHAARTNHGLARSHPGAGDDTDRSAAADPSPPLPGLPVRPATGDELGRAARVLPRACWS